jgi:hypothetical protein
MNVTVSRPLDLSGHRLSVLRFHMAAARNEQQLARQTENLDLAARHCDRADEHMKAILNVLEAADCHYDL